MVNKAMLAGYLGRDPEMKYSAGGTAVATFSLATSRRWKDKDGNKQEDTQWHNIKAFGKQAEVIQQYLKKGSPVFVEGRIETRAYDDKDGNKKWFTEIVLEQFQFLGKGEASQSAAQPEKPLKVNQTDANGLPF